MRKYLRFMNRVEPLNYINLHDHLAFASTSLLWPGTSQSRYLTPRDPSHSNPNSIATEAPDTKLVDAMDQLAFCEDVSPSNRFRILSYLIDQDSGRPAQSISVTGVEDEPLAGKLQVHIYPSTSPGGLPAKDPNKLEE